MASTSFSLWVKFFSAHAGLWTAIKIKASSLYHIFKIFWWYCEAKLLLTSAAHLLSTQTLLFSYIPLKYLIGQINIPLWAKSFEWSQAVKEEVTVSQE